MKDPTIIFLDGTCTIRFDEGGKYAYSRFPHPLVTVDYDTDEIPMSIEIVGSPVGALLDTREVETPL